MYNKQPRPYDYDLVGIGAGSGGLAAVKLAASYGAKNEYSRTSQPHIFAIGDCSNRVNLTPIAIAEGHAFADTDLGIHPSSAEELVSL